MPKTWLYSRRFPVLHPMHRIRMFMCYLLSLFPSDPIVGILGICLQHRQLAERALRKKEGVNRKRRKGKERKCVGRKSKGKRKEGTKRGKKSRKGVERKSKGKRKGKREERKKIAKERKKREGEHLKRKEKMEGGKS